MKLLTLIGMLAVLPIAAGALAQGPPPATVRVGEVKLESVQQQRLVTGELRAMRRARVAGEEPSVVLEAPFDAGDVVKAGDALAKLDARRLEIDLQRLQADEQVQNAAIEERKADLQWREEDLENYRNLRSGGASNPKELYDAQWQVRIAAAKLHAAEQQLQSMRAEQELLKKRIADMTIKAPFDGVIVVKHIEQGEWLAEGGTVAEIISTGAIEAWLDVPQQYADAILGSKPTVSVNVEATSQTIESAQLRAIPQVDPQARTFSVVVKLANEQAMLAPGMSVTAWVPTGDMAESLTVPKDAVMRGPVGAYVYVARQTNAQAPPQAMPADVQVQFAAGDRFVVRSSVIAPGDMVVTEGNERLFPTQPLAPVQDAAAGVQETSSRANAAEGAQ